LVTLGDVITGKKTIERGKGVKIVDLTGAGAQDAAIAGKVMEKWDNKVE
jgi:ornithine cyclodeaminase/alanine dehydrogenase-like protein (mu-crystallin family)